MASKKINSIILSLCEIIVGIILLVNPITFTRWIIAFFGIIILIMGFSSIVGYIRSKPAAAALKQGLAKGLTEILFGVFCILRNEWFIVTFPIITVLYGIATLLMGIAKIQWTVDMLRLKAGKWIFPALGALLDIVCAAIILYNPFSGSAVLWIFIAVTLIVGAIIDIITAVFFKRKED